MIKTRLWVAGLIITACAYPTKAPHETAVITTPDSLPPPHATKSYINFSNVIGWEEGQTPKAPEGFQVTRYADGFENPRWMVVLPNGDVLVAESNSNHSLTKKIAAVIAGAHQSNNLRKSADRITLLRDADGDGIPEIRHAFLDGLNQPFGMALIGDQLFVANTDAVVRFAYQVGQVSIRENGIKVVDLPAGKHNQHWTRNIVANREGTHLFIAVGSGSNIGEHGLEEEKMKAAILRVKTDGSDLRVFASGLRNPVGMAWAPETNSLWVTVNERDGLGDDLVPDYLTEVKENGFYGWPFYYYGKNKDPRVEETGPPSQQVIVPDVNLGPHTASLGLVFYDHNAFPEKYRGGAFIAQHGSWNRSVLSGYKVVFVPFTNGLPSGDPEDFLTGFIADLHGEKVHGRPTGLALLRDGSVLVTDDVTNTIWRVSVR